MNLNFNTAKPIYWQIVDEVKRAVVRGELQPGERILSIREMAEQLKVNPNTVQRAYQEMERLQLTETLRGQGVFIRKEEALLSRLKEEMAQAALGDFIGEMAALGFTPRDMIAHLTRALQLNWGNEKVERRGEDESG